jgi:hypothetical protein
LLIIQFPPTIYPSYSLTFENRSTTEIYLHRVRGSEGEAMKILEERVGIEFVDKLKSAHESAPEKKEGLE